MTRKQHDRKQQRDRRDKHKGQQGVKRRVNQRIRAVQRVGTDIPHGERELAQQRRERQQAEQRPQPSGQGDLLAVPEHPAHEQPHRRPHGELPRHCAPVAPGAGQHRARVHDHAPRDDPLKKDHAHDQPRGRPAAVADEERGDQEREIIERVAVPRPGGHAERRADHQIRHDPAHPPLRRGEKIQRRARRKNAAEHAGQRPGNIIPYRHPVRPLIPAWRAQWPRARWTDTTG